MKKAILSLAAWFAQLVPVSWRKAIYRIPWLAKPVRATLNKAAPGGLVKTQVAAGALAGMCMMLDLQREKDYWLGTYELDLQAALQKFVKPGMTLFDVGANIGYITLLMARLTGEDGSVFSFEALPANIKRLNENLAINNLQKRVTCIEAAVGDTCDNQRFFVHNSTSMGKTAASAGRLDEDYMNEITVSGMTLDDFVYRLKNPVPSLVKMDIEGGEVLALPGMKQLLRQEHPVMLIELHGPEAARAAFTHLTDCGYHLFLMEPGYPEVTVIEQFDWKSYIIGCKDLQPETDQN